MNFNNAASINKNGVLMLGLTAVPVALMTARTMIEEPTEEEKLELEQEKVKRAQRVAENVKVLKDIEEQELKDKGESFTKSQKLKGTDTDGDEEQEDNENSDDDMEERTITFDNHGEKVEELANITPDAPELEDGMVWLGKLALRELRIAVHKTEGQKSQAYADGSKLQDMLDSNPYRLDNFDSISKYKIPRELRQQIRAEERKGWKVRRVQLYNGVFKGLRVLAQARECMPWVLGSMGVSATLSFISTTARIYQARTMDALISNSRSAFAENAKATVIIEILSSMIRVLESQLNNVSQAKVSESISLSLCRSLLSKDMIFWKECKEPWAMTSKLFSLPYNVSDALQAPQHLITKGVSIITMMVELSRTSGNMLKMLTLLQFAQLGVQRLINYLTNHVRKRIMAKIVSPTRDQFSFFNALKPEFAQMFQAFARTQKEVRSYARYMKTSSRRSQLYGVVSAVTGPVDTATNQATRIVEYNTMKGLMASGDISFTEAQNMLSFAEGMTNELRSGYDCIKELSTTMDPLASAADIIDIRPKIDLQVGIEPEGRAKGQFVFENVKFKYPGKIGKGLLLKGISFKVTPGQVVGITGETGCGKSTTLRLIQRFYDVTEGSIFLDGRDIREYNPEWLRSQIVIVEQEPRLLPMTIRENLIFGCKTEPTIEEIEKACRSAQIWDALNDKDKFPEFLETRLHQIPSVAGGEKQRICIARAILMDPPVLLLDEATSALDEVSQQKVQEALQELMKGRTTLVVAHRLSTIKDSDKIIGVKDGIVVDEGTHEELLQKKDSEPNVWKSLWKTMQGKDSHDPPVPSLQRTTTTTAGKFAVLRSALTASLPKAKADAMIRLVNDLENGGNSDDDYKDLFEAASHHVSKWSKVRGAVLATKFQTTSKVAPQEAPVLKRQSSVAEETVAKLTKTLSSSSSAPTTVAAQALPQRW